MIDISHINMAALIAGYFVLALIVVIIVFFIKEKFSELSDFIIARVKRKWQTGK